MPAATVMRTAVSFNVPRPCVSRVQRRVARAHASTRCQSHDAHCEPCRAESSSASQQPQTRAHVQCYPPHSDAACLPQPPLCVVLLATLHKHNTINLCVCPTCVCVAASDVRLHHNPVARLAGLEQLHCLIQLEGSSSSSGRGLARAAATLCKLFAAPEVLLLREAMQPGGRRVRAPG